MTAKMTHWQYPNFLIIGAMKSGTTPLYDCLGQHPQVFMTNPKEPHFFSTVSHTGPYNFEGTQNVISDPAHYQGLFQPRAEQIAVGEASTSYLYSPGTAQAIYERVPHARLICLLRNPVERAYSHYLFLRGRGVESLDDFAQALAAEPTRRQAGVTWGQYLRLGMYASQLQPYFQLFPRTQIGIFLFDDLRKDSVAFAQKVFRFLEIDESFVPDVSIRRNPGGIPKNRLLNTLLVRSNPLKNFLQPRLPRWLYRVATKLRDRNLSKPPMANDMRKQLIAAYRDDVLRLQEMTQLDLTGWLQ